MPVFRFEDIAVNSTKKKKPEPADKDTYIGLEHLDPGTLFVNRFGAETAPKGEKLLMKKGDVLFGKRRAYQKKVSIAPFDGIFSAHGMVLRPKTEVISEAFFPFFISSDYFLDAAIKISVGSLSPTINWKDIKGLEFYVPELTEQDAIAEKLWLAEIAKSDCNKAVESAKTLLQSYLNNVFSGALKLKDESGQEYDCSEIMKLSDFVTPVNRKNKELQTSRVLTISAADGIVDQLEYFNKTVASKNLSGYYLLMNGEFAYNKSYSIGNPLGSIQQLDNYDMGALSNLYICFAAKEGFLPDYLKYYFKSECWYDQVYRIVEEGARAHGLLNMSKKDFFNTKHRISCSVDEQKQIINHAQIFEEQISSLQEKYKTLADLERALNDSWVVRR